MSTYSVCVVCGEGIPAYGCTMCDSDLCKSCAKGGQAPTLRNRLLAQKLAADYSVLFNRIELFFFFFFNWINTKQSFKNWRDAANPWKVRTAINNAAKKYWTGWAPQQTEMLRSMERGNWNQYAANKCKTSWAPQQAVLLELWLVQTKPTQIHAAMQQKNEKGWPRHDASAEIL